MIGLKAHNIFARGDDTFLMLGIEGLESYERAMAVLEVIRKVIAKEEGRRRRENTKAARKASRKRGPGRPKGKRKL